MLTLLSAAALAADPIPEAIQAQLDTLYGKPIPPAAICVAHPELTAPFQGSPTPVAVRRGARGCVIVGVMVGDQWFEPGAALAPAVDRAAWDALPAADREARWLEWTDEVLLAFAQPVEDGLAKVFVDTKRGVTVVDRQYLRREEEPGRSADVVAKWTYGADLAPSGAPSEQVLAVEDVSLFQRSEKVVGLSEAAVTESIRSKGLVIRKCFTDAWEEDLGLDGRVRLEWTVSGGKVAQIQIVADEDTNNALAGCYARAVKGGTYPSGASGDVRWVFGVERTAVK